MRMSATVLLFALIALPCRAAAPPGTVLSEAQITDLVRQLGSEEFRSREQANRTLRRHPEAEAALRGALASSDAEVVRRARSILAFITRTRLETCRQRLRADAAAGRADVLAERLVQWQGRDDDEDCWQAVLDLGHMLRAWEHKTFKRIPTHPVLQRFFPGPVFRSYVVKHSVRALPAGRPSLELPEDGLGPSSIPCCLARGNNVRIAQASSCLIVASAWGCIPDAGSSMVVSGGDVELGDGGNLVVVCDGDLVTKKRLGASVIVARGSVHCSGSMRDCLVLAGGDVSFLGDGYTRDTTVRAGGKVSVAPKSHMRNTDFKGNLPNALARAPLKFFEPASAGVAVAPSKYGVRLTTVTPGQPFAHAGLAVDDLVTAVDGGTVRSPAAFRRLLRKRLVQGGTALFEVRRGGSKINVRVPFGVGPSPLLVR